MRGKSEQIICRVGNRKYRLISLLVPPPFDVLNDVHPNLGTRISVKVAIAFGEKRKAAMGAPTVQYFLQHRVRLPKVHMENVTLVFPRYSADEVARDEWSPTLRTRVMTYNKNYFWINSKDHYLVRRVK